jgi:arginine decarboxylase
VTASARRMRIPVVTGIGHGGTLLSAFDDALRASGVHNYNLVPLSSVIPPETEVVPHERYVPPTDEHGHRLYVVKAEVRSDHVGTVIAAGVGWYQWGDGRGVFVEHETAGSTYEAVSAELDCRIRISLEDLCGARDVPFHPRRVRSKVTVAEVEDRPTSALVLAVYQSEPWR